MKMQVCFEEQNEHFVNLVENDTELKFGFTNIQTRIQPDYNKLINRPSIQDVPLEGSLTLQDLGTTTIFYNTTAYWDSLLDLVPERGSIYIYSDYAEDSYSEDAYTPGIKVGDGSSYLIDLPFVATQSSYTSLSYKPLINGVVLEGSLSLEDLGISPSQSSEYHTTTYWNALSNLVSKSGYIYIYSDRFNNGDGTYTPGIKIGDGKTYLIDLPFIDDRLNFLFTEHEQSAIHITDSEREYWNNKVTAVMDPFNSETLLLTTENISFDILDEP